MMIFKVVTKSDQFEALKRRNPRRILLRGFSVPYDILFSNEFLRDLGRLWSLRDIVPDPNNLPWIEKDDK